jgi:dihydropyrimidinase
VRVCSENPAKIFGLYPRKGRLEEGSDADIVIVDPTQRWTVQKENQHSNAGYSLYEGLNCRGKVQKVFSRGRLIVEGDAFVARNPAGKFLPTRS